MTTSNFVALVNDALASEGLRCELKEVTKENGVVQHGITLVDCQDVVTPVVYLSDAMLDNDDAPTTVAHTLIDGLERGKAYHDFIGNLSKEYILSRVMPELVNADTCAEWIKGKAFTPLFSDLGVIYRIVIEQNADDIQSAIIPEEWLKLYDVSYDDLMTASRRYADEHYTFKDMFAMMCDLVGDGVPDEVNDSGLFVLSNETNIFGASSLLSNQALNMIHEKLGDVYIIPSSIHEVLILPCKAGGDVLEMAQMIQEINRTTVKPREVLGNHAYKYDGVALQDA